MCLLKETQQQRNKQGSRVPHGHRSQAIIYIYHCADAVHVAMMSIQLSVGRHNSSELAVVASCLLFEAGERAVSHRFTSYVDWRRICIYMCVDCGPNTPPTTFGSGLAVQIITHPH